MSKKLTYEKLEQRVKELEKEALGRRTLERDLKIFKTAVESSINAIGITDLEGKLVYANDSCVKMWGYNSKDEILGRFLPEFWEGDGVFKTIKELRERGLASGEDVGKRKDGSLFFLQFRANMFKDDAGNPSFMFGSFFDITKRKQVEMALQDSEEKYRQLFSAVSDAIMVFDAETKEFIDANDAVSAFYGYTREEFLELKHTDITAEPEKSNESIKQAISGELYRIPLRYHKKKDGTKFPVEISSGAFKLGDRQIICGVVRDITERMQADGALRESEKRYRAVVESQTEMICCFHPDGTITFVNDAYCRYFNKHRDELIGHKFMPLIPESDQEKVFKKITSLNPNAPIVTLQHRVVAPNGKICWQKWTNRAIYDNQNHLLEYQAVGWDITERVRAEEALREAHEELEHRVKARTKELDVKTKHLEELNAALKILLDKREEDKAELEEKILSNVKTIIEPYVDKLKQSNLPQGQKTLIDILESNLNEIVSPFSRRLSSKYLNLSPSEVQVANLVKQGKTNKEIAEILLVTSRTIAFHRENIRKKLGLINQKTNLKTYLMSLD